MPEKTIALVAGYWSTNIGNSFFQLGAEYLLQRVFPDDRVVMLSDQPGYWNVTRGNPSNAFILLEQISLDYLVILGPFLRPEYDKIWLPTLRKLYDRGTRIIILSTGMMDYDQSAVEQYRVWLSETPPFIFTTRDERTYSNLADIAEYAYNGIDTAFFVSDLFRPIPMSMKNFLVFNFDKIPEPTVWKAESRRNRAASADYVFKFRGDEWRVRSPKLRTILSQKFRFYPFIDAFWPHTYPEQVDDWVVVRTDHRFNPMTLQKIFRGPNSFASDIPYTYLNLYANADLTLSNRVHACAAALAYGKPAMLLYSTPRAGLLERVGAGEITGHPQSIDMDHLAEEKSQMIDFLSSAIG